MTGGTGVTGESGDAGAIGPRGDRGPQGPVGRPGSPGDQGSVGFTGFTGDTGPSGSVGIPGQNGTIFVLYFNLCDLSPLLLVEVMQQRAHEITFLDSLSLFSHLSILSLYISFTLTNDADLLQQALDALVSWKNTWQLSICMFGVKDWNLESILN